MGEEKQIVFEKGGVRVSVTLKRVAAMLRRGWKEVQAEANAPAESAENAGKVG